MNTNTNIARADAVERQTHAWAELVHATPSVATSV